MRVVVEIPKHQIKQIVGGLEGLGRIAVRSAEVATRVMAENVKKDVVKRYNSLGNASEATLEKRKYGKKAGVSPSASTYSGSQALIRSGRLVKLVTIKTARIGNVTRNRVFVRPSVKLPGGTGISDKVARANEYGETHTIRVTPQMRKYLHWLLAQSGRSVEGINATEGMYSQVIVAKIPKRPVWIPAAEALISRYGVEFMSIFEPTLKAQTKFKVNFKR